MAVKLNLSVILKHLDTRNLEIYEAFRSNEAERKELDKNLAYLLPLWFSGTYSGEDQLTMMLDFNRHVNLEWSALDGHPELRAKVLGAIGLGRAVKHDFHYRERRATENALTAFLNNRYPDIRKDEIALWCLRNSEATLVDMCSIYGIQEKETADIVESYRKVIS
jgi:hypothetical protein